MQSSVVAVVLIAAATTVAWAGPPAPAAGPTDGAPTGRPETKSSPARDGELSADMASVLRKAGFTDLQVMPNSVFVRGKDKAGHPVAMVLNPGSMTEVVTLDPHAGTAAAGNGMPATLTGSGTFATILPSERLASSLLGVAVTNTAGDKVGTIKDMAIDHSGVHAYIVGVGGLFGIGDRYVAVTPGALSLAFDQTARTYRATMRATVDQLKDAPEFRFQDLADAKGK